MFLLGYLNNMIAHKPLAWDVAIFRINSTSTTKPSKPPTLKTLKLDW